MEKENNPSRWSKAKDLIHHIKNNPVAVTAVVAAAVPAAVPAAKGAVISSIAGAAIASITVGAAGMGIIALDVGAAIGGLTVAFVGVGFAIVAGSVAVAKKIQSHENKAGLESQIKVSTQAKVNEFAHALGLSVPLLSGALVGAIVSDNHNSRELESASVHQNTAPLSVGVDVESFWRCGTEADARKLIEAFKAAKDNPTVDLGNTNCAAHQTRLRYSMH